jgi:hypothetical protein
MVSLKAKSISFYESNAVINKKVEIERIDYVPIKCRKGRRYQCKNGR